MFFLLDYENRYKLNFLLDELKKFDMRIEKVFVIL